ncbi:MAG: peroxiredoxin [Alphaproteobacteria bacterium]|nr:peroxiredoxin [Alphaproteobacteria bacterium]
MQDPKNNTGCHYDYANKCDCSEDDKCGCDFPNNLPHDFSLSCLSSEELEIVATQPLATAVQKKSQDEERLNAKEPTPSAPLAALGKLTPDFTAPAILSDNTLIKNFNLYKYIEGHNAVLFFYPEDFSFTCPSELLMLNEELNAFTRRNTKVIGISTDSIYSHLSWKELPLQKDGIPDLSFPLIADLDKEISTAYQVLNKKETALRATFIIDTHKAIRHISLNDGNIRRTPTEMLRIIDLLNHKQDTLTDCPQGWKQNFFFERPEKEQITEIFSPKN